VLLATLIARVSALMALHCGWPQTDGVLYTFESATYTMYLSPRPGNARVIDLPHPLVSAITSAHIDPDWGSDIASGWGAADAVASTDRMLDTRQRELWLATDALPYANWSPVDRANKIVFVAGFLSATPDIVAITATAVKHMLDLRRVQGSLNLTQGGQTVTRTDGDNLLPALVRDALTPYVVWSSRVG
jgi:hypothetical protein